MRADDMILVSVDDHICEPADMFDGHVPEKYRELTPRVVTDEPFEGGVPFHCWVESGQPCVEIVTLPRLPATPHDLHVRP